MTDLFNHLRVFVELAGIIAGEAGNCPHIGQVAVGKVWENRIAKGVQTEVREGWFGWAAPQKGQLEIAFSIASLPDPTGGAVYLVSSEDYVPWLAGREPSLVVECDDGTSLMAYR